MLSFLNGALAVVGVFVVVVALFLFAPNRRSFDSALWQNPPAQERSIRIRMVDSLLWRYDLVGMRRAEVSALLGKPPETNYFSDYDYVYWLGPERGFLSVDSEWLALKFKDNVVVEARVMRD